MNFAFTAEQEELRTTARAFLAEHAGPEQVRAAMASEAGYERALWKRIGAELGWTAVAIPEAYGGLGLSWVEVVALQEVLGEALYCGPYFATVCLAAPAIEAAGDEAQKMQLLGSLAGEGAIGALAHGTGVHWRRDGDGYVLTGRVRGVVDGHCADLLVVAADEHAQRAGLGAEAEHAQRAAAGEHAQRAATGLSAPTLFALPSHTAGLARSPLPTMDQTRRLAELRFDGVRVPASARLGAENGGGPALARSLALGTVALAAELVGVAQRSLDLAVAYAKERVQFGRPIGSFQALKHKCADMMVKVEAARSAVYWAGCVAAEPEHAQRAAKEPEQLARAASAAKAAASDAAFFCAGSALQIFGGVGFTAEYDVHLYFKRARAAAALLGDVTFHRERVAQEIGL